MYYVYVYLDPRKNKFTDCDLKFAHQPFYVGKGKGKRAWKHLDPHHRTNNTLKLNKIKNIINAGYVPIVEIIKNDMQEDDALLLEQELIQKIGTKWNIPNIKRGPLTNQTSGGDGRTPADEIRYKFSMKGERNPMFGKTHSPEAREKIRQQSIKLRHSEETKRNMRNARSNGKNYNIKSWEIICPDDTIITVVDLAGFARSLGVHYQTIAGSQYRNNKINRGPAKGYKLLKPLN